MTAWLRRIAWCAGAGAVAGVLTGTVAAVHVGATARRFFVSDRELEGAVGALLGVHAAVAALTGLGLGLLAGVAIVLGRHVAPDVARGAGRVVGALVAPALGASAWVLTAGPQARRLPGRALIVAAFALLAGTAVALAVPRVARWVESASARARLSGALALGLTAAGLVLVDARVLPRLYPLFHAWVGGLAAVAMTGATLLALRGTRIMRGRAVIAAALVAAGAVGLGAWSVGVLLATQNARSVLAERAPLVGRALQVAAGLGLRPPSAAERIVELTPELEEQLAPRRVDASTLPDLDVSDRDLLLVTIDALRADHLGAYGYRRATSPRIDALARDAVVFDRAYTATPQTSYAVASFLTGKYVHSLFRLDQPPSSRTLAHMLRERGMRTAAFFTDAVFFIDRERFEGFEEERFGFEYSKMHPVPARPRLDQVREYLEGRSADDRLFVWVHFFEPHEPYEEHPGHHYGDRDVDRYDSEIAETDSAVGDLVEMMRARGREPIVVLTADHGEEFGEHGGRYHGSTLYDEQARVPLIMRVPGIEPRRVSAPVQTVDVVPTILGLYAVPWSARVRGTDLRPLLFGRPLDTRVFAEGSKTRMLVVGAEKLVCDEEQDLCQLYDLERDPGERHSLADAQPDRVRDLRRTLTAWAASHARFERATDALPGAGDWPEAIRRAQLGDEGSRATVITLLASERDPRIRAKAAEVLGPLGGDGVIVALERALADPDAAVSAGAALSLYQLGDEHGVDRVRRLAVDEATAPLLRRRAVLALGAGGDPVAAPGLRAMEGDREVPAEERSAAARALGGLRDRAAVPVLLAQMDDVRQKLAVVQALTAIADRRALPTLRRTVVQDPYDTVRAAAARGLLELNDRGACGSLRRALSGREPVVGALEALVGLGCAPSLAERAPSGWRCDDRGCAPPAAGGAIPWPRSRGAARVAAWWTAAGDGGRLLLGGQPVDLVSGTHEGSVDLTERTPEVSIAVDPSDRAVSIHALMVVPVLP